MIKQKQKAQQRFITVNILVLAPESANRWQQHLIFLILVFIGDGEAHAKP